MNASDAPGEERTGSARVFVAVSLPLELQARIKGFQQELRDHLGAPRSFRWTRMDQAHLTLKFFGQVPWGSIGDLEGVLRAAVRGCAPVRLAAGGLGFFPNRRKPRVCWVGISGELTALGELQESVDRSTERWAARETRAFAPHLTLARVKEAGRELAEKISELPEELWRLQLGEWEAREVRLMRSELHPDGAQHTDLAVIPLPGGV